MKDAVLVDVDPAAPARADGAAAVGAENFRLVRSGSAKLKILETHESASIGNAKLQWARVEVDPSEIYEVQR